MSDDDGERKMVILLQKSLIKDFYQLPVSKNDGKGGKVVSKAEVFSSNTFSCFLNLL